MVLPNAVDTNCSGHEEEEDREEEAEEKRRKDKKRQTGIQSSALYGVVNSAGLQGLRGRGYKVLVSHPKKTRLIAESRIKTDRVDSWALTELVRLDALPLSYVYAFLRELHQGTFDSDTRALY